VILPPLHPHPPPPPPKHPPKASQTLPTGASRLTRRIANDYYVRTRNANDKAQRISHGWFATVAQEQEQEQLVAPEALQEVVTQETRAFR
jgi:hypothetical protein